MHHGDQIQATDTPPRKTEMGFDEVDSVLVVNYHQTKPRMSPAALTQITTNPLVTILVPSV